MQQIRELEGVIASIGKPLISFDPEQQTRSLPSTPAQASCSNYVSLPPSAPKASLEYAHFSNNMTHIPHA
jgi:hypothetical protein